MLKHWPRISRALLLAAPVIVAGIAAGYNPPLAAAQEVTEPVCYAEWCEGNVCVRVKIKCPEIIEPIAT